MKGISAGEHLWNGCHTRARRVLRWRAGQKKPQQQRPPTAQRHAQLRHIHLSATGPQPPVANDMLSSSSLRMTIALISRSNSFVCRISGQDRSTFPGSCKQQFHIRTFLFSRRVLHSFVERKSGISGPPEYFPYKEYTVAGQQMIRCIYSEHASSEEKGKHLQYGIWRSSGKLRGSFRAALLAQVGH